MGEERRELERAEGYTEEELMDESDSDTDDELEEQARERRKQKDLYYKNLKDGMMSSLGLSKKNLNSENDKPEDYYYNSKYHETFPDFLKAYLDYCAVPSVQILDREDFNNGIIIVIIVAGINVGIQTYPATDQYLFFKVLDFLILIAFIVECALKIAAEGIRPHRFFTGPEAAWNNFDFLVIFFSIYFSYAEMKDGTYFSVQTADAEEASSDNGGGSVALLRLVRLARLGKLIKKIPPLQMIMSGLLGGLSSITYILLLLFLVFYLYAIVGMMLYKKSDPFHFGSLPIALLNLFRISLLENWSDIMYVNIFGCDYYTDVYVGPEGKTPRNQIYWCDYPTKDNYFAPLYFISFIFASSFVMLSLFIGAITMSMSESMEEVKANTRAIQQAAASERKTLKMQAIKEKVKSKQDKLQKKENDKEKDINVSPDRSQASSPSVSQDGENILDGNGDSKTTASNGSDVNDDRGRKHSILAQEEARKMVMGESKNRRGSIMNILLAKDIQAADSELSLWGRIQKAFAYQQDDDYDPGNKIMSTLQLALGEIKSQEELEDELIGKQAESLSLPWYLEIYSQLGDVCKIVAEHAVFQSTMTFVIIMAGLNVGAQSDLRLMRMDDIVRVLDIIDIIISVFFAAEVVLKIVAEKWAPINYFHDDWNKFDFVIVVGSFVPGVGSVVTVLRLLRLLRILKLVRRLPGLYVVIQALINGLASIGYVGVILFLVFYFFSIIGIILFKDNDPWHFGLLHLALISLFRIATLDNVSAVMTIGMYGCDLGGLGDVYEPFPDQCTKPQRTMVFTVMYFIIFVVLAAQVLLTLFIGVISTSMEEARASKDKEMDAEAKIAVFRDQWLEGDAKRAKAFQDVFEMLDLDGGGAINVEELDLGLECIDIVMTKEQIRDLMIEVNPKVKDDPKIGLNVVEFMNFMLITPKYKQSAEMNRDSYIRQQRILKKHKTQSWFTQMQHRLIDLFPFLSSEDEELRFEAALVLQDAWRARQARKNRWKSIEDGRNKAPGEGGGVIDSVNINEGGKVDTMEGIGEKERKRLTTFKEEQQQIGTGVNAERSDLQNDDGNLVHEEVLSDQTQSVAAVTTFNGDDDVDESIELINIDQNKDTPSKNDHILVGVPKLTAEEQLYAGVV